MKKLFLITSTMLIFTFINAQKTSTLPSALGRGQTASIFIVENGTSKKISVDSLLKTSYELITQNAALLGGKQNVLIDGLTIKTINNQPLIGNGNLNIIGASNKPLFENITSKINAGNLTWNFDSSSTASISTNSNINLNITGSIPTGATGILTVTQSAAGNNNLNYNGIALNIAKQANKTSIVGFVKNENGILFSIDTTVNFIADAGSSVNYDVDATALFTAAATNNSYKTAVNDAIIALKGINLAAGGTAWTKSIMINGRAGTNLTQQSFNWKNQNQYNYVYNGPFVYNSKGTQFNGVDNDVSTGITPSTAYTGTTSDIAYFNVIGDYPAPAGGFVLGGANTGTGENFYLAPNASNFTYEINGSYVVAPSPSPVGRFFTFYSSATVLNSYRNGVLLDSRSTAPRLNLLPFQIYEGAISVNNATGTGVQYRSAARIDVTQIINSKLTVAEAQAIDAIWANYQTALNR